MQYTRAVRAVKMDRMFAKPFIGAMDDHSDGVYASAISPTSLVAYVSGAADGECIVWDLASRKKLWSVYAHSGFVRGLTVSHDGQYFFSCGDDRTIKQYRMAAHEGLASAMDDEDDDGLAGRGSSARRSSSVGHGGAGASAAAASSSSSSGGASGGAGGSAGVEPVHVWSNKHAYTYIDHHFRDSMFATSSTVVSVWDWSRSEPIHSYSWGADTITTVRFNPAERSLLASTGNDRSVCLYDLRTDNALRKTVFAMNCNSMAWNPREPFNFSVANEDHNLYTFDMRKLDHALQVHKDHAGAVMDVHYAPTGKEFVSGSYDRTVRIWRVDAGKSREVYHTSRMQRVFTVRYTGDAKYVLSGSDDANVRIWKARANESLGRLLPRERAAKDYAASLKQRFAHVPEVRKIANHRHVPQVIMRSKAAKQAEEQRDRRKLANVRAHSKPGSGAGVPEAERKKHLVGTLK